MKEKKKEQLPYPEYFTRLMVFMYSVFALLRIKSYSAGGVYLKGWRFINFCVVGGIGVLINYAVFFVALPFVPWFICNALAIIIATFWNYWNDVGGWAKYWGFTVKLEEKKK